MSQRRKKKQIPVANDRKEGKSKTAASLVGDRLKAMAVSLGETAIACSECGGMSLRVGGGLGDAGCGDVGSEEEVLAVEGSVAEYAVVAVVAGAIEAVEAGNVPVEDVVEEANRLQRGQGVDIGVFVAYAPVRLLDVESG